MAALYADLVDCELVTTLDAEWRDVGDAAKSAFRKAVSAYLGAVGARVERYERKLGAHTTEAPVWRLVIPWKPLTDTQKFETEEAMRFGPRSYTDEQQAVINQAVAERKPLSARPLTDTEEETDGR